MTTGDRMRRVLAQCTAMMLVLLAQACAYMKVNSAPDADKTSANNTCYLATAANMLAGAGYGTGSTMQQRSDQIYGQLISQFGTVNSGWTDAALSWWLSSANNTWTTNPYTVVTVYGNKTPRYPWADANGAQFIGDELRACRFVGLSISWPTAGTTIGSGGHAITGWGDEIGSRRDHIATNPSTVRVTDSDNDTGGNVQVYRYDAYTNPNPGGANEGNGWYFDYDPNHPYIKHIVTLASTATPAGTSTAQKVIGSYRVHQTSDVAATDLHYDVKTDTNVLSYYTSIDWGAPPAPTITEAQPTRNGITVDWDLSKKPVPKCNWVTIDTEFILPAWNAIRYENVRFTYPKLEPIDLPLIGWKIETPPVEKAASIPDVTGGYVVGAFTIVDPRLPADRRVVGEYRLVHQYSFNQSPEHHAFTVTGPSGLVVTDVRFGHSYGIVRREDLWKFKDWLSDLKGQELALDEKTPARLAIDWPGRLPYPKGEDIGGRIRERNPRIEVR